MNPEVVAYTIYSIGTPSLIVSFKLSGNRSKNGMAINAPAAKAVINPSLFLNLATNKPPANVERKAPMLK